MLERRAGGVAGTGWVIGVVPVQPGNRRPPGLHRFPVKPAAARTDKGPIAVHDLPVADQLGQLRVGPPRERVVEMARQPRDIRVLLVVVQFPVQPCGSRKIPGIKQHMTFVRPHVQDVVFREGLQLCGDAGIAQARHQQRVPHGHARHHLVGRMVETVVFEREIGIERHGRYPGGERVAVRIRHRVGVRQVLLRAGEPKVGIGVGA